MEEPAAALLALGLMIRKQRELKNLTQVALSRKASMSQPKLSKIENGQNGLPDLDDINLIVDALGGREEAKGILRQFEIAQLDPNSYDAISSAGVDRKQAQLVAIEKSTRLFRVYEFAVIPGLLQTVEYATGLFRQLGHSEEMAHTAAGVRQRRQFVTNERGRDFRFVVSEFALYSMYSEIESVEIQCAQLDVVVAMSHRSNISVQVIPARSGFPAHAGNSFTIYDRRYVTAETTTAEMVGTRVRDVVQYERAFDAIQKAALGRDQSRSMINDAARQMNR